MIDLLFFLLLGHFCGDFALQSDRMAEQKRTSLKILTGHITLYVFTIAVFMFAGLSLGSTSRFFQLTTVYTLAFLFIEHWLQDFLKARIFNCGRQGYYIDQAIHVLVLFVIRIIIYDG